MKGVSRAMKFGILVMAISTLATGRSNSQQDGADEPISLEQLREMRRDLAFSPRGILANNDGCDALYFPRDQELTVQSFLDRRTTALADDDSQVGAIAYCTISSGFSFFTHDTKVGTVLTRESADYGINPQMRNATQPLIDLGSDCLQSVVDFCRENDIELFWSMRMNDTHDVAHTPDDPYLLFPPLKEERPDLLVGAHDARTPFGRWSSVDYAQQEVRDLAFAYVDEVCRNYDVDGIELDFFRHLCYFASVANGGVASDQEREAMTDLMRRIRAMTEEVGMERGRPILVAIRVPDSVSFSREMGFDLERWLQEGLVDILLTTCYFRLNPWEYSVELGHAHDVAVYLCLSDSRVQGETRFRRRSVESYRGRAMNAWAAGADGIHTFNLFNPNSPIFREIGDPQGMATMDKLFFATVRDGDPERWLAEGEQHRTVPVITPGEPSGISSADPLTFELWIGEDFEAARAAGGQPTATLHLEIPGLARAEHTRVSFNGHALEGTIADGWLDCPLPVEIIDRGRNTVEIQLTPDAEPAEDEWTIEWKAEEKPQAPWHRDRGSERTVEELGDGALLIADRGTESGDYLYYRYSWGADPSERVVVEARARAISGSSYLIVGNGVVEDRLGLHPDRIDLWANRDLRYEMDTTDDFHTYRIVMEGRDLQVFVDGELRLDATGRYADGDGRRRQLAFGAANSPMVGEALWSEVRARLASRGCRDVVVSVTY